MQLERFGTVPLPVTAIRLTVDNLEEVAQWCNGAVRGVLLPADNQCVELYFRGEELYADVGDWIVSYNHTDFYPYPDEVFQQRFISY